MINMDKNYAECEHGDCEERIEVEDLVVEGTLDLGAVRKRQAELGWLRVPVKGYTTVDFCPRHVRRID